MLLMGLARVEAPAPTEKTHTVEVQLYADQRHATPDSAGTSAEPLPTPAEAVADVTAGAAVERQQHKPAEAAQPASSFPPSPAQEPEYLPAGTLDSRPRAETPVIIPFPSGYVQKSKMIGILILYISADGQVDRVEVDRSELPPDYEQAAIAAFRQARMQPGIKDGKPTRARMKILVEFEAR
jgi:TonB family protein